MTSVCGLCRRRPETVPRDAMVPDVVSDLYSDWDRGVATVLSSIIHGGERAGTISYLRREQVVQPDGTIEWHPGGACDWCIWAHRHRPLRSRPHLVNPDRCEATPLLPSQLRHLLQDEWPPPGLLCVPFSRKKHVAPFAVRGVVCVDDQHLTWTHRDAQLVTVVAALRDLGAGEQMQTEAEPPWPLVRRHGITIHDMWRRLDPWRRGNPAKHTVALLATRRDKTPEPKEDPDDE